MAEKIIYWGLAGIVMAEKIIYWGLAELKLIKIIRYCLFLSFKKGFEYVLFDYSDKDRVVNFRIISILKFNYNIKNWIT